MLFISSDIPFVLSEQQSRLSFVNENVESATFEGVFRVAGPNITAEQTITVNAMVSL